ncbi:MAG: hypothetical protein KAW17_12385 [Candidatus Eisenbacteria sp.]|nr:hypothetical protein [Candidatus Eisenbacteria bacterium]
MKLVSVFMVLALVLLSTTAFATEKPKPWQAPTEGTRGELDCTNAIPIFCGDVVTGDNTGMPNNVEAYSCVGWTESGGEVVYELDLSGTECWIVTVDIDPDGCDLDVFFLGSCDEADCIDYGDYGFVTECLLPGMYYLVVDGYSGAECPYTLSVTCEPCDCPVPPCCPFPYTCLTFDFNESPNNFFVMDCGGEPVWEWGTAVDIPDVACDDVPVTAVLGTVLGGEYHASSGEIAVIGPFVLDYCCWCMELCHFFDIETRFDGGNVKISVDGGVTWELITPAAGYPDDLYGSCACIPNEWAFTGHMSAFQRNCFDVSQYTGMEILVGFFFGSDSSVQYPGWYIKWVKFGGYEPSATEDSSWGGIKAMYR